MIAIGILAWGRHGFCPVHGGLRRSGTRTGAGGGQHGDSAA